MSRVMVCGPFSSLMEEKAGGGYSFADEVRRRYLEVLELLERNGFEVLSAHRADQFGESEWIADFVERDLRWVDACDVQLVMLPADPHGAAVRSDGTMLEMGYAVARGKPLVILADDPCNPRNSFFLNSFVSKNTVATVLWGPDHPEALLEALRSCDRPRQPRVREQRTDVDAMIDDLRRDTNSHRVQVAGLEITVLPGVLSPRVSHAPDALMQRWQIPPEARVLDLGCGSGILGLAALSQGAARLVALDINPAAVETTALNLNSLGFADRGEARWSDGFSALRSGEEFDVIIFAAPYWDRHARDDLEKSCFDFDYQFFSKTIRDAHLWLADAGSMYVIFSDQGDVNKALDLIEQSAVRVHKTHLVRPTLAGGHIRIVWELKRRMPTTAEVTGNRSDDSQR